MVVASAHKQTEFGARARAERSVSDCIPYTRLVDEHTVATKDGYLLQTLKIDGYSFETADQVELNHLKTIRATLLRGLANSRLALYHHIVRREVFQYPAGHFEDPFCRALDVAYRQTLSDRRMFVNEQYLTLVRRPVFSPGGVLATAQTLLTGGLSQTHTARTGGEELKALRDGTDKLIAALEPYGAKRLGTEKRKGVQHSELLSFLGFLINGEMRPVRLPRMPLASYLPTKRLFFGRETVEVRGAATNDVEFGAILSIRDYDTVTGPGILDELLRLPHAFTLTQSFSFTDRQASLQRMNRLLRQLQSTDEGALSLEEDLASAIDETASGKAAFGEHHLSVLAKGRGAEALSRAVSEIDAALTNFGIISVREDLNLEPAYWAQLPGNQAFIARRSPISTKNFSSFASLHTFPSGQRHGQHWGEPISLLETTSGSPYWFSFHDRDVGNFTLIGPTGSGKTVLLTFFAAHAQRLKPRLVYYDKDRGADIFIRAIGGDYSVIRAGEPAGLNPLHLPDTASNRAWLRDWLSMLATLGTDKELDPREASMIDDAIAANYHQPLAMRRLSALAALFTGFETGRADSLAARLQKWHSGGAYAWLFDNETDRFSTEPRVLGYDLTEILEDPIARTPWLMYNFHRIDGLLGHQPCMLILDEGWKLLDDPAFASRIKDWEKTIRKRNGLLGFATQSVGDVFKSQIGDAIIEQSPTNIFLPNPRADERTYCEGFGLSKRELRIIRELSFESRCFLVRHGKDSVIARLDLAGLEPYIAVLSGRSTSIALADTLRSEHGDMPEAWLPHFMEAFLS